MKSISFNNRFSVVLWTCRVNELIDLDPTFSLVVRRISFGKRDLLKPGHHDGVIRPGKSIIRRRCLALYVDDDRWPLSLRE